MNSINSEQTRPDATVIVCTYNRSASLRKTLSSLAAQRVREGVDWELLVVDNNSKDDTRSVVEGFAANLPRLRYCFEPRQGLSHARNHGISVARGELILFTDDDVLPEPDWIQKILDGMTATHCEACGGYIAPIWEVTPPSWLTDRFHGFLAIRTNRTDTFQVGAGDELPYGANMAFRRSVFERFGMFDVTRGRKGNVLASGEDGELFDRIRSSGGKIMFFGDARVHHAVEAFRLNKRYFRRWRYQTSRNLAESRGFKGERRLFGVPFYLFPQLLRAIGRAFVARVRDPADVAFQKEIIVWHFLGAIAGLWRSRGTPLSEGKSANAG